MDVNDLTAIVSRIEQNLHEIDIETKQVLADTSMPDSYKRNRLVDLLARTQVELIWTCRNLSEEIDRRKSKKIWQFWK